MTPRRWLLAWLLALLARPALAEPAYPPYTRERVTLLAPTTEDYSPLRDAIRTVEQDGIERYAVVVREAPGETSEEREMYPGVLVNRWYSGPSEPVRIWELQHMVLVVVSNPGRLNIAVGRDLQFLLNLDPHFFDEESANFSAAYAAHPGETVRPLAGVIRRISRRLRQEDAGLPPARRGEFAEQLRLEHAAAKALVRRLEAERRAGRAVLGLLRRALLLPDQVAPLERLRIRDPYEAKRQFAVLASERASLIARLDGLAATREETKALRDLARAYQLGCRLAMHRLRWERETDLCARSEANEALLVRIEEMAAVDSYEAQRLAQELAQQADRLQFDMVARAVQRQQEEQFRSSMLLVALPLAAGVVLPLGLVGLLARHRLQVARLQRKVTVRLAATTGSLQRLHEQLEVLARRLAACTGTEEGQASSLSGETRERWEVASACLEEVRSRWNDLAAAQSKLDKLVRSESWLGTQRLLEADRRLAEQEPTGEIDALLQEAESILVRLEAAPGEAARALRTAEAALSQVERQIGIASEAGLSLAFCNPVRTQAANRIGAARKYASSDPFLALEEAECAAARLVELNERLSRVSAEAVRHGRLLRGVDALETSAANWRAAGVRLREPGIDPDPLLANARDEAADAWRLLDAGEPAEAATHLALGEQLARRADRVVAEQVRAREFCLDELSRRREGTTSLRRRFEVIHDTGELGERVQSQETRESLHSRCIPMTEDLAELERQLAEAEEAASEETQQYGRARELLQAMPMLETRLSASLAVLEAPSESRSFS